MIEIIVNIVVGYPKLFIKDLLSEPYDDDDDDDYSDNTVTVGLNGINILCQPAWEKINRLFITINDSNDKFDESLKYYRSYNLTLPSGVLVIQDDATAAKMADNTYMTLKCMANAATIKVFLDDAMNPSAIGLAVSTTGVNDG